MPLPTPALLIAASAAVILTLGLLHLLFTFWGTRLHPRDAGLMAAMQQGLPQLTRETTVWKAWVGFNASHSYGAMLFGLVYGYLALVHPHFLLDSIYLLVLGAVLLAGLVHLGHVYWFSIPFRGIALASVLYVAGLAMQV